MLLRANKIKKCNNEGIKLRQIKLLLAFKNVMFNNYDK
jgi:hypothetical protein